MTAPTTPAPLWQLPEAARRCLPTRLCGFALPAAPTTPQVIAAWDHLRELDAEVGIWLRSGLAAERRGEDRSFYLDRAFELAEQAEHLRDAIRAADA